MLGLRLREEFRGKLVKGTAIELTNAKSTGATQVPAAKFLEITYPSIDLLKALEAVGPSQNRPVVLIGERGQGKSHLLATLYHALTSPAVVQEWLRAWAARLGTPRVAEMPLRSGMHVVRESLHRQNYKGLWDVLLDNHPHGAFIRGKWEAQGARRTDVLPQVLLVELLQAQPTALILDEYQTWFDGLPNKTAQPLQAWAFNFIQLLSEVAQEHPDLLVLVVSVRNGNSDAFQQIHRVSPLLIDFKAPGSDRDRRRLLLHRLFENRSHIASPDIQQTVRVHVAEMCRLLQVPLADQDRRTAEVVECWPFAPHLLQLLEDQVLIATAAQETRDLIRILAGVFKAYGEGSAILTAAAFRVDEDSSGVAALLESVANQQHAALREKAQRNVAAVCDAIPDASARPPHLPEIVGSLWLRSLAVTRLAGTTPAQLQLDLTRERPIDDNAFHVELAAIKDNSFNIHEEGDRIVFREEENPQAKLMAFARNDRLFSDHADRIQLAKEIRYVLGGAEEVSRAFRVVVLPNSWVTDPWCAVEEPERPERWDERLPLVALPESPDRLDERLGRWLKEHLTKRRNTVRFLLPRADMPSLFQDRNLIILARMVVKAQEWKASAPEYARLLTKYQGELRTILKTRFDRFALLRTWSFAEPSRCRFQVEAAKAQGAQIADAIETTIANDLFVPEDFAEAVSDAARRREGLGKLLRDLQEPRGNGADCIAWLGTTQMVEKVVRLCARGLIAIDVRGSELLQREAGEDEETAWRRMRFKVSGGRALDDVILGEPQASAGAGLGTWGSPTTSAAPPGVSEPGGFPPLVTAPAHGIGPLFATPAPVGPATPLAAPATSPLNLLSRLESWGVGPATRASNIKIRVGTATGAQLTKLLKSLPDGMTYALEIEKDGD
jgi:hypothetical protein